MCLIHGQEWKEQYEKLVEYFVMWKLWGVGNSLDTQGMKIDVEEEKECWKSISTERASKGKNAVDNTGKTGEKNGKVEGSKERWLK